MKTHIALFVLSVFVLSSGVAASDEITIRFPRSVVGVSQHGNLLVVVNYQNDARNRELELVWDSTDGEGECGSSAIEITAESNGIPFTKDLTLSAGEYVFVATLYRSDGSKAIDRQTRFVIK